VTKPRPAEFKWRQFEPPLILMAVIRKVAIPPSARPMNATALRETAQARCDNAKSPDGRKIEVELIMQAQLNSRVMGPNRTLMHL
jgi:hypothetical protein